MGFQFSGAAVLAAFAALLVPVAPALAQSNALAPEESAAPLYGIALMKPQELGPVIEALGLEVRGSVPVPAKQGMMTIAVAGGQMPFLFVHSGCIEGGCLFLEMIQPVPIGNLGLALSSTDINDFNRGGNFVTLTAEEDGQVAIRYTLPGAEGCDATCLRSNIGLYAEAVFFTHDHLRTMAQKDLVSLEPRRFFPDGSRDSGMIFSAGGLGDVIAPASASTMSALIDGYLPGSGGKGSVMPSFEIGRDFPALLPQ